jgi:hypothetical protein
MHLARVLHGAVESEVLGNVPLEDEAALRFQYSSRTTGSFWLRVFGRLFYALERRELRVYPELGPFFREAAEITKP